MSIRWSVTQQDWIVGGFNPQDWFVADGTPDGRPFTPAELPRGRVAEAKCNGCHTTGFAYAKGADGRWTGRAHGQGEIAIACEACHGPGSRHVDEARAAKDAGRRLQAGQVALRRGPLRLDLLMEEVAAGVRVEGCTVDAPVGEPTVVDGDYALLRQATETVARNAASRSTKVTLAVEAVGNEVAIVVSDDGPGFPAALVGEAAFERFLRGDGKGSTGLGLAIAARIVGLHGGRCVAVNPPGGGAEVRLVLGR